MSTKILFSGYAPVHFVCFRPLYERLAATPGVEVYVSGGERHKTAAGFEYDELAMYRHFGLPPDRVLSVEAIRDLDFDVTFAAHTKLIEPRRTDRRIQIFHGISFRNKAVRPENMGCDDYFIVGPYMRRRFAEAGLLPPGDLRAVQIGFPKTDRLLDGTLDRAAVLAQHGFDGTRPVLLYAPTGAKRNSLEIMGEAVVRELLASKRYDVIVKLHDHPKNTDVDWVGLLSRYEGENFRVAKSADVIPLMHASDLLITDASSVANEYTLLDRPLVFLDTPELIEAARAANNSMLDLDTWGRKAGITVKQPGDLCDAVAHSLSHLQEKAPERASMRNDFFYNPGCATEAAMVWLEENLLRARAAA